LIHLILQIIAKLINHKAWSAI